jgi:hypothetical protein
LAAGFSLDCVLRQLSFPIDDNYLCRFVPLWDSWVISTHSFVA